MEPGTPLSGARFLVATDLDGDPREAKIRQAVAISEAELRSLYADRLHWRDICEWSRRDGRILARRQQALGALVLDERPWDAPPDTISRAAFDGLRALELVEVRQRREMALGEV